MARWTLEGGLARCAVLAAGIGCRSIAQEPAAPAPSGERRSPSEVEIDGITVTLTGPEVLPLGVVVRGDPAWDASRALHTVTLKNVSARARTVPLDELQRAIVRVYADPTTGEQVIDAVSAPPRREARVTTLQPGEPRDLQVVFDPPATRVTKGRTSNLDFCVRWDAAWLRVESHPTPPDWNHTFELCRSLQIVED